MAASLLTLEEYDAFSGFPLDKTRSAEEEQEIDTLIASASHTVATYCNRNFREYISEDYPYVQYDYGEANTIFLTQWPVISLISVEFSSDNGLTYTTLTENVDYIFLAEEESIVTVSGRIFSNPPLPRAVKVTYTAGYEEVPQDLKHLVYLVVKHYKDHEYTPRKELGADSLQFSGFSFMDKDFPAQIKRLLELYRDPNVF